MKTFVMRPSMKPSSWVPDVSGDSQGYQDLSVFMLMDNQTEANIEESVATASANDLSAGQARAVKVKIGDAVTPDNVAKKNEGMRSEFVPRVT